MFENTESFELSEAVKILTYLWTRLKTGSLALAITNCHQNLFNFCWNTYPFIQVDVEGSELKALPEWINSGVLDQVSQFGLEIHTGIGTIPEGKIVSELTSLLDVMRNLHKLGFHLISNTNNDCMAKSKDLQKRC